jgi:inositol oxygenase
MCTTQNNFTSKEVNPLTSLDEWEDDVVQRYPEPYSITTAKTTEEYRNYDEPARDTVKEFYRLNHTYQTFWFVQEKRNNFLKFDKKGNVCLGCFPVFKSIGR